MHFPNLTIKLGDMLSIAPAIYFDNGEALTYEVTIEDQSVATYKVDGKNLVFNGLKVGTTKASIKAGNGETQSFIITVRQSNGWL